MRAVDGVAAVVAGAVLDVGDELGVRAATGGRDEARRAARRGCRRRRGSLARSAADVVGLADAAVLEHGADGAAVVVDVEPVADVLAVAVDGQGLAVERVVDHQRDELLGKLVGAVVVRAVGGQRRQAVGVELGADEMVAGGLGRGVGAVGRDRACLRGRRGRRGRASRRLRRWRRGGSGSAACASPAALASMLRAASSSVKVPTMLVRTKAAGPMDGAVDVALGGEVNDGARLVLCEEAGDELGVADVAAGRRCSAGRPRARRGSRGCRRR